MGRSGRFHHIIVVLFEIHGEQRRAGGRITVEVGAAEGGYRPAARDLVLRIRTDAEPSRVTVDGEELPEMAEDAAETAAGWSAGGGFVTVRLADRWEGLRVDVE